VRVKTDETIIANRSAAMNSGAILCGKNLENPSTPELELVEKIRRPFSHGKWYASANVVTCVHLREMFGVSVPNGTVKCLPG
jgi:hypothetical protein